jgi:hypothetical protein
MVSFTNLMFYLLEKRRQYPLNRRLCGPQNWSGCFGKEHVSSMTGIVPRFLGCPACSPVTRPIPSTLLREIFYLGTMPFGKAIHTVSSVIRNVIMEHWGNDTDRKTELLPEEPVPVLLCPPQIPHRSACGLGLQISIKCLAVPSTYMRCHELTICYVINCK